MAERVTRGSGLLEGFLARRRAAMALRLLDGAPRSGGILDVGCGRHPSFLLRSGFAERFGVDQLVPPHGLEIDGARLLHHAITPAARLPFEDHRFHAVTMLAVFEHIAPAALPPLLADTRRVLRHDGLLVITTPASWTDPILRTLARLRLVSGEEIHEHQDAYDHGRIRDHLLQAGFPDDALRFGSFELGMNLWATARP
ncbi:MAG TPA: class I SAM-dependent methyltransferase [Longimicrobiales bacterium]|nr:class I SAM-dependent methyltransferase [Longimicrobiales bacterium]